MHILQVTPYFAPAYSYGGPPTSVHHLSKALAERGHKLTILTSDALDSTSRQPTKRAKNGLDIYYLKNLSNYLAWNHQLFLPFATHAFLRKRLTEFDVVHMHMFRTYQNIAVRRHSQRVGVPYVLSAHGSFPRIVRKRLAKGLYDIIVGQSVVRDASRLIAVAEAEARQYQTMGVPVSKIEVIPNGIAASEFLGLPEGGRFSRRHGLEGKRLVTYVGRLNARKGLETLVESFGELAESRDNVALVLVGPDEGYRRHLESMIKRIRPRAPVVFTGLITLPQKLEVFVDSDVIVYPGAFEIFGLVPFEALLCGTPVIVADDSGCGEIIAKADAGLTVHPGNSKALSKAISTSLDGGALIDAKVERGKRFVQQELDWRKIAQRTENVYDQVVCTGKTNRSH